jgi:hypothetical protein
MVETTTRFDVVNKHVNNTYTSTIIAKDLAALIALELETYAELLKENGDVYGHCAGLQKAAQIVRDHNGEREL